jgi:hypothetical protein
MTKRGKIVATIAGAASVIYGGGLIYDVTRLPNTPVLQAPLGIVLLLIGSWALFAVAREWIRG